MTAKIEVVMQGRPEFRVELPEFGKSYTGLAMGVALGPGFLPAESQDLMLLAKFPATEKSPKSIRLIPVRVAVTERSRDGFAGTVEFAGATSHVDLDQVLHVLGML